MNDYEKIILHNFLSDTNEWYYCDYFSNYYNFTNFAINITNPYERKYSIKIFGVNNELKQIRKEEIVRRLFIYLKNFNDSEFEVLSSFIATCIVNHVYKMTAFRTQKSKDQGVDFLCEFNCSSLLELVDSSYIIGQSKCYGEKDIGVNEIRDLIGSYVLFKNNITEYEKDLFFNYRTKPFSDIKSIFVTNTFFSKSAELLSKQTGIITIDFLDIIYLVLSKYFIEKETDDIETYLSNKFKKIQCLKRY